MINANTKAMRTPIVPTASEVLIEWKVLEKISLPVASVPNR